MQNSLRLALGGAVALSFIASALPAQTRSTVPGFNITYTLPAGWKSEGRESRAEAWSSTQARDAVLVIFGGAFSPLELAFTDASRLLEELPEQEPQVIEAPAERAIGARRGLTTTIRARGADGRAVTVRIAAVTLRGNTTLAAIAILPAGQSAAQSAVFAAMDAALGGASAAEATEDTATRQQIVGTWASQSGYNSGGTGGGFVDETTWRFESAGSFTRRRTFTASLPGAAVTPTREEQQGRWRVIGQTLVLESNGETATLDIELSGRSALIGTQRFNKR